MKPRTKKHQSPQTKVKRLRTELCAAVKERKAEITGLLTALLARDHALLLGETGTAKTMLVELMSKALSTVYFYWLMTRFTVPEEVFGNFSLQSLKDDKFERVTTGKLPEAEIVFLDEVFKANSSILNAMLTLLNERKFHNGTHVVDCPLQMVIGASNELPESKELDALYDRFPIKFWVSYIKDQSSMREMLLADEPEIATRLTAAELAQAQAEAAEIALPEKIVDLVLSVKIALEKAGFVASDRLWRKSLKLMRALAYLEGESEVTEDHVLILCDVLWKDPKDRQALGQIVTKAANPIAHQVAELLDAARETFSKIPFSEPIEDAETSATFNIIVDARVQFNKSIERLHKMSKRPNNRITDALEELAEMKKEASRFAAEVAGA